MAQKSLERDAKMTVEEKLKELGVELPVIVRPMGVYSPAAVCGNLLFTAGQTPRLDGKLKYVGKLGETLSDKDGYAAARQCLINCLAIIKMQLGSFERVDKILKMNGYINCTDDYTKQSEVLNGASDLLADLDLLGVPARSALGVNALPGGSPCEVELVVALKTG